MTAERALRLFADAADLARRDPADGALYRAVEAALAELVGFKLLTVLRLRDQRLHRLHTSDLRSYPAGGFKDIRQDAWLQSMLAAGTPVISSDPATVRARFVDHEAIFALGCGAVMNLPVTSPSGTLGSLNVLHQSGWFQAEHVLLARPFVALLGLAWSGAQGTDAA